MTTSVPADAYPRHRRGLWIAVALLAVAAAAAVWFLWKPQWQMWCHGADKVEFQRRLLDEPDPALADVMARTLADSRQPDTVRLALGELLLKKNRVGKVEDALRDGRLDVRVIALRTLARQTYFRKQYVEDPSWNVGETFLAWLQDGSSRSRSAAILILPALYPNRGATPPAVVQAVRDLARPAGRGAAEGNVRAAAAWQLAAWDDCDSAAALLDLARTEEDPFARMRVTQAVVLMHDGPNPACRAALPADGVRAAVARCLAHEGEGDLNRSVRMAAMQILARHPDWAVPHLDFMRAVLDGRAHEVERRTALEALASSKDPVTIQRFARYFHDPTPSVRSGASAVARDERGPLDALAFESCLVGFLRDETAPTNELAFRVTMMELRRRAGRWEGFPADLARKGPDAPAVADALSQLFAKGSVQGTGRAAVAEAWFRWFCVRNGVTAAAQDEAVRAREDFWARARANDAAGAKAVHDAHAAKVPNLWTYERGWLLQAGAIQD